MNRHRRLGRRIACALLLGAALGVWAQTGAMDITVEAPPSLAAVADRVRRLDQEGLVRSLAQAGLHPPGEIRITLIPEEDPRAKVVPRWIVGLSSGDRDIAILPGRVGSYPYDSLDAVVWHEIVHAALTAQAGGRPVPRWFHEGVAMSVERGWGVSSQLQLLLAAMGDPGLTDLGRLFQSGSQSETSTAYLLAAALVSDLRQRHGTAVPGAIVDRVAGGASFTQAFVAETGETPASAAARAWRGYQRWASWLPVVTSVSTLWMGITTLALLAIVALLRKRRRRRREWDEEEGAFQTTRPHDEPADESWASTESDYTVH